MLFMPTYRQIRRNGHLGDLIATVQWLNLVQCRNHNKRFIICSDYVCSCCGNKTFIVIPQLLALFSTKIKFSSIIPVGRIAEPVVPFFAGLVVEYQKGINLPIERGDFITCQFIPRGEQSRRLGEINQVLNYLSNERLINLGDFIIPGTEHFRGTILKKFSLIASAKMHLGIDSGMSHLAAMTYTPTIVISNPIYFNRYNEQKNISIFSSFQHCKGRINEILSNYRLNDIKI